MRLETPVVYFHPGNSKIDSVNFAVAFKGGLLSQFYPNATAAAPATLMPISDKTVGSLTWTNIKLGGEAHGPKTDSHVWLAPRNVDAANVTASSGESERYLFYRGVGHLDSPLRVVRSGDRLNVQPQTKADGALLSQMPGSSMWYFDMRDDGRCAYTTFKDGLMDGTFSATVASFNTKWEDEHAYDRGNLQKLRTEMHAALARAGLFDDEAEAMLNTWEASYFKSPGARVFFIVPRSWTDEHLPIKLSVDADMQRVMVGRVDLITPAHREILAQLAATNGDLGKKEIFGLYHKLGRFAGPIVRDEANNTHRRRCRYWRLWLNNAAENALLVTPRPRPYDSSK